VRKDIDVTGLLALVPLSPSLLCLNENNTCTSTNDINVLTGHCVVHTAPHLVELKIDEQNIACEDSMSVITLSRNTKQIYEPT
jgi:hypothetical protein